MLIEKLESQTTSNVSAADKANAINATNLIAWKNEFYIWLLLNRIDDAVLPFNKYVELSPNDPKIEKIKAELLDTNKKG